MLTIISTYEIIAFTLYGSSAIEEMLFAAIGTVNQTAVFINLSYTGSSDSALAYLADYVPCFLVNDCLVCILET